MSDEIDIELFSRILIDAIKNRRYRLERKKVMNVSITQAQINEIETMYKLDPRNYEQKLFNDILCDVLEVLEIDYEIDIKKGLSVVVENE